MPGRARACYVPGVDDDSFPLYVAGRLAGLPGVAAVTLGGSRAEGTHRPDSDWDFSIYYRGRFDPQTLCDIGWPGEVFEVGGWGKGVFNGGAWLMIDGRKSDVHYRDLDVVDREIAASRSAVSPSAPGSSRRRRRMRRTRCWRRAGSGSPTTSDCSPARACAGWTISSPPRARTRPSCAISSTAPGPSAQTHCRQFIPSESYAGDISFCAGINSNNANYYVLN